jgi:hypothetical protein
MWIIKKHTEETEYPSLDGGHTLIKETKVTVGHLSTLKLAATADPDISF